PNSPCRCIRRRRAIRSEDGPAPRPPRHPGTLRFSHREASFPYHSHGAGGYRAYLALHALRRVGAAAHRWGAGDPAAAPDIWTPLGGSGYWHSGRAVARSAARRDDLSLVEQGDRHRTRLRPRGRRAGRARNRVPDRGPPAARAEVAVRDRTRTAR